MAEINISDINRLVLSSPEEFVRQTEEEYDSLVDSVARRICDDKNVRILLLAGPSGSGKTTTANILLTVRIFGTFFIFIFFSLFSKLPEGHNLLYRLFRLLFCHPAGFLPCRYRQR